MPGKSRVKEQAYLSEFSFKALGSRSSGKYLEALCGFEQSSSVNSLSIGWGQAILVPSQALLVGSASINTDHIFLSIHANIQRHIHATTVPHHLQMHADSLP